MAEQNKAAVPISEKNKYIFLSVPNFKKSIEEVNSSIDKWLYLLNHAKDGKKLPSFGNEIIQDAIERIKVENASDELLAAQEANMTTKEDYESWAIGLVINASEKAMAKGRAEGRAEGAADERSAVALDMLADNEPIEKIVKYSHLPESKVLELRKSKQR
jgi:predicted transposase/invertase (TIGR01784 family)